MVETQFVWPLPTSGSCRTPQLVARCRIAGVAHRRRAAALQIGCEAVPTASIEGPSAACDVPVTGTHPELTMPNKHTIAANDYAARGWSILPLHEVSGGQCSCGNKHCTSPGKHPRTPHGLRDATADVKRICSWWERWPQANIGILTGQSSGLVVVDLDPRHGGLKTWAALLQQHSRIPRTVQSLTGGGARHLYFAHPGGNVRGGAHKLGAGVDVKGRWIRGGSSLPPRERRSLRMETKAGSTRRRSR